MPVSQTVDNPHRGAQKSLAEFAEGEKNRIHFCAGVYRAKIQGAGERAPPQNRYPFEAQQSGFKWKRRSSGAGELSRRVGKRA